MSLVLFALALLVAVTGVILWASGGRTVFEAQGAGIVETIPGSLAESSEVPADVLTLFSSNLAYGLGGGDRQPARRALSALYDRLDRVIEEIAASEADAALLQAVDFASRRTGGIQQLHYVAAALGWRYVAAVTTWECRFLPAPWRQAGRVRAGQGIISRLPLEHNGWHRLPKPQTLRLPASPFAPHDTVQVVDMRCGVRGVRLIQANLTPTRAGSPQRTERLAAILRRVAMPGCIVAGIDHVTAERASSDRSASAVLRAGSGGVLLGSIWPDAEVRLLAPMAGVSEHAPVLVNLSL